MTEENIVKIEESVLGALLGASVGSVALLPKVSFLNAGHFSQEVYGRIFQAIMDMSHREGLDARPVLLADRFGEELVNIGGREHLVKLAAMGSLSIMNLKGFAKQVVDAYLRRKLTEIGDFAKNAALNYDGKTANETILAVSREFEALMSQHTPHEILTSKQVTERILEDLKEDLDCYPTGIKDLTEAMRGGLYAGKAYAIAARKKVGKTIIASTISQNLNLQGVKHLFIAAEMSPQEIQQRNIARGIGRNSVAFLSRDRKNIDFRTQIANYCLDDPGNIHYLHVPGISFDDLRRNISIAISKYDIKGFILDYFQLVSGAGHRQSKVEFFDEVAQWIANICREEKIWALVTAQINQEDNIRWGEGIRLSFDQVYHLKKAEKQQSYREAQHYLEIMDTRYTPWIDVGSEEFPVLVMDKTGPYFRQE